MTIEICKTFDFGAKNRNNTMKISKFYLAYCNFRYEPFTRAKHRLIIVTIIGKPTNLKTTLNEIANGKHNHDHCHLYKKRYLKKIGAIQGNNSSAPSVFRHFQAKLGHGREHRNHFCKYKRGPKEAISSLLERRFLPEKSETDSKKVQSLASAVYVHPRGSKGHSARERPHLCPIFG